MQTKKRTFLFLILISCLNSYAQIQFEKGYFINNEGERTECLIKNKDWRYNPVKFDYKLSEDTPPNKRSLDEIKEFGIYKFSKYIKAIVEIDRSGEKSHNMSNTSEPIFSKEELFLKVLIEGRATLYLFEDGSNSRFFYKTENSGINQLIFKTYITPKNKIRKNETYKYQLFNNLRYDGFTAYGLHEITFSKKELVDHFEKFNLKKGSEQIIHVNKNKKNAFNISILTGMRNSTINFKKGYNFISGASIKNEKGFTIGLETEVIFQYNRNKWAFAISPTYQYFNSEKVESGYTKRKIKVNYSSIELPFGIRHYFFLNGNSRFFITGSYIIDLNLNSRIESGSTLLHTSYLKVKSKNNFAVELGYKYKRYGLNLKYSFNREIMESYPEWSAKHSGISLLIGYTIFKNY